MIRGSRAILLALVLAAPLLSGCLGGTASDWAYQMTGLRDVQKTYQGEGIRVAVVDTGIDPNHPSLDHARILWKDFVNGRPSPYDDVGHGSHVAGILVGKGASFGAKVQGFSLKGASPDADLIVVKAIRSDETGSAAAVAGGIDFAIDNNADVICLSLGAQKTPILPTQPPGDIKNAVDRAVAQGILVVASAGNLKEGEQPDDVRTPAVIDSVIAVGAVGQDKKVATFSAQGDPGANDGIGGILPPTRSDPNKKPEIVAPGVSIKSAWKSGDYAIASGTSQAAPFVCGALALLLESCPSLRADNSSNAVNRVKSALMSSAEKVSDQRTPHDNAYGYGLLRADRLVSTFDCR